ncbi:MAG TPA: S8 family serine peptidase, partial [Myxococcota bacterium]|nr:S8 family serine peptidase [Myxococcota bacterium]
ENYDVAGAILAAAEELLPGDVLLIEQQGYVNGAYCPVSADPAVYDAITYAVAAGIVVVEPGGNGSSDLDARSWQGWFDRSVQDSGSILVGGGAGPDSGLPLRSWMLSGGSSYGQRVDMQGWYTGIVTTANGDMGGSLADLALVGDDSAQGYTESFGGTSGASPMVASVAAAMQGLALAGHQPVWEPRELRAILVNSGTPQTGEPHIGPQPDLRRLLRTWGR